MDELAISEASLKRAVRDYLQYKTNLGELYADQLFSGEAIEVRGKTRRKIQGCQAGTADFFVLKNGHTIFLELKGDKGRQTPAQGAFQKLVKMQKAEYHLIHSIEELQEIIPL